MPRKRAFTMTPPYVVSLVFEKLGPASDHRQHGRTCGRGRIDEKPAVASDVVLEKVIRVRNDPRLEQHFRRTGSACLTIEIHRHQLLVGRQEEDPSAVAAPPRLATARSGNLNATARAGEALHEDLAGQRASRS